MNLANWLTEQAPVVVVLVLVYLDIRRERRDLAQQLKDCQDARIVEAQE